MEHVNHSDGRSRSIPSLDGLRAIAVFTVILGHTRSPLLDRVPLGSFFRNGEQGVAVFFAISGFLITHLLLKELRRERGIHLRRFYLRRTLRIFPPYYVYLAAVAALSLFQNAATDGRSMLAAVTYTWNYVPRAAGWNLGHCWSLAVEEQFYAIWPVCMKFFSRRANLGLAAGVILLSPVSRVLTYAAWPAMRPHIGMMLHTRLDTIMTGCLLSLLIDMKVGQKYLKLALHPAAPAAALVFLLALDTPAAGRWHGAYLLPLGYSLENVAIAALLLYVVFRHESPLGKFLNLRALRHLGIVSYSLYLWQQLFTGPHTSMFPLNVAGILGCAEISYLLIERPSFRLRGRLTRAMFPRQEERASAGLTSSLIQV